MTTLTRRNQINELEDALLIEGTPAKSALVAAQKSASGVPIIVLDPPVTPSTLNEKFEIFGLSVGYPVSKEIHEKLAPEQKYLIRHTLDSLRSGTNFAVAVTSFDKRKTGAPRTDSIAHSNGWAVDVVFLNIIDEQRYVVLDLMNSVSFLAYLSHVARALHPMLGNVSKIWNHANLIFGCEYDHVHIEFPWAQRNLPARQSNIRIKDVPSGIQIGSFYNPQPAYGLPALRPGDQNNGVLSIYT
jgi:hypothetical protein